MAVGIAWMRKCSQCVLRARAYEVQVEASNIAVVCIICCVCFSYVVHVVGLFVLLCVHKHIRENVAYSLSFPIKMPHYVMCLCLSH